MKNNQIKFSILLLSILLANASFAQLTPRLFLSFGKKGVELPEKQIFFSYVDDSPSQDNLETMVTAEPFENPLTGSLGFIAPLNSVNRWLLKGQIDAFFQQDFYGASFELGAGYVLLSAGKLNIMGDLFFGYNLTSLKLGEIQNNSLFIQINNQQFFERSLNVRFDNYTFSVRPNLSMSIDLLRRISLYGQVGYLTNLATNDPKIDFRGIDESESIKLSDPDANLLVDGSTSEKSLLDFGGFSFNFGIGLNL